MMGKDSGNYTQCLQVEGGDSGLAVAGFLTRRFPDNPVKRVGRLLPDVSTRTIENWMQGKRPNGPHMDRLVSLFGLDFVKSVWGAALGPLDQLEAIERLENVEAEIAALNETLRRRMDSGQGELPHLESGAPHAKGPRNAAQYRT